MSLHRLAFDVMRSADSATPRSRSHVTRAAVSRCMAGVDGVSDLIALIATVLSVNEHTVVPPTIGCKATSPNVEAASSRSQMSNFRSSAVHSPWQYSNSPSCTVHAPNPASVHSRAASAYSAATAVSGGGSDRAASGTPTWSTRSSSAIHRPNEARTALLMTISPFDVRKFARIARHGACSHCRPSG